LRIRATTSLSRALGLDRARPRRHRLFDRDVVVALERASAEPAEDDSLLVDHEAGVPVRLPHPLTNLGKRFVEPASGDVAPRVRAGARLAARAALERKTG